MIGSGIPVQLLMTRLIANLSPALCSALQLPQGDRSVGLISTDCDDMTYIALDAATKAANVRVAYGRSLYGGAGNASTRYAGEVIGILSGPTPAEIVGGLEAAKRYLEEHVGFQTANASGDVVYLAHCVARTGTYLSQTAGVPVGSPLAYLVAPPVEAIVGLDAAMKASDVTMVSFFSPPTETNFAGGLLTGTQSACQAACEAFAAAVVEAVQMSENAGGM